MAARGDRLTVDMTKPLAQALQEAIGKRSVYQAATEWGIPHWILRDTLSGKIDCPSPRYLREVAHALGWSVEDVISAAYEEPRPAVRVAVPA